MDNRKQQPFAVNQRVVYLEYNPAYEMGGPTNILQVGKSYRVTGCFLSGVWYVSVDADNEWAYVFAAFAPYDPPAIEIPAELLEVDVKDGIDVKPVKEII